MQTGELVDGTTQSPKKSRKKAPGGGPAAGEGSAMAGGPPPAKKAKGLNCAPLPSKKKVMTPGSGDSGLSATIVFLL